MVRCLKPKFTNKSFSVSAQGSTDGLHVHTGALAAATDAILVIDGTLTPVTVAPAQGWRLSHLMACNDTGTACYLQFYIGAAYATARKFGTIIAIPEDAGAVSGVAGINLLDIDAGNFPGIMTDNAGNFWIDIPAGMTLFPVAEADDAIALSGIIYNYET